MSGTPDLPRGTRLILVADDLLEQFGSRNADGYAITAEWGEQKPEGWYVPTFTVHYDRPLPALARVRRAARHLKESQ